jgi:hypothetical protein
MSMLTYTAHRWAELLLDDDDGNSVVFIKDGFSWPAFVIPFVWMIWHRLWLALVAYIVAVAGLAGIGYLSGFPDNLATMLGLLVNVFFGLEGNNLRRRALARRGYHEVADVVASDRDEAAWRYFSARQQPEGA